MNDEVVKQLLRKISSLESRISFLENNDSPQHHQVDPSYWQNGDMRFTGVGQGYQPIGSTCSNPQPPKER